MDTKTFLRWIKFIYRFPVEYVEQKLFRTTSLIHGEGG